MYIAYNIIKGPLKCTYNFWTNTALISENYVCTVLSYKVNIESLRRCKFLLLFKAHKAIRNVKDTKNQEIDMVQYNIIICFEI